MQLLKSLIILIVGFVLLIKGADFFVEGSSAVAKRLRIPSMIIGMTIVAMGTSLPECAVSVTASLTGNNSLAISNAVGSNIFNLLVVCGVCSLFVPLAVQKSTLQKEFPLSIFCAGLLLLLGYLGMTLGRIDGIIFLIIFAALDDPLCQKSTSQYNFCGFFFCTKSEKLTFRKRNRGGCLPYQPPSVMEMSHFHIGRYDCDQIWR